MLFHCAKVNRVGANTLAVCQIGEKSAGKFDA